MIEVCRDAALARELFAEYGGSPGVDLSFQDFERELATLPGHYDPILIARINGEVAGCVALRALDETTCEMKRLYVRPAFRGQDVGRALAEALIQEARRRGFARMRLDTLPAMREAMRLYESLGFHDIAAYRFNPVEGTRFLERDLRADVGAPALREARGASHVLHIALLFLAITIFMALRLPLLTPEGRVRGVNSDTAIHGLMGEQMKGGSFPIFFWRQNYLGPLTAATAAVISLAADRVLAVRLAGMLEVLAGIILYWWGLRRIDPWLGSFVALLLAAGSPSLVRLSVSPIGAEMAFLMSAAIFALVMRQSAPLTLGMAAGLGWWMNQQVVFTLAAAAVVMFFRSRLSWRAVVLFAAGFAVAYAPVWLGRLLGWYEPAHGIAFALNDPSRVVEQIVKFVRRDLYFWSGVDWSIRGWIVLAVSLILVAMLRPRAWDGRALVMLIVAANLGFYFASRGEWHYLVTSVAPLMAVLVMAGLSAWRLRALRPVIVVAAIVYASLLVEGALRERERILSEPDPLAVTRRARALDCAVVYADFWISYQQRFLGDDSMAWIPYLSRDRSPADTAAFRRRAGRRCVVNRDGTVTEIAADPPLRFPRRAGS